MNENGIKQIPVERQAEGNIGNESVEKTFSQILDELDNTESI